VPSGKPKVPTPIPTGRQNRPFLGGKVTFRGGEGRITGKGTIRTPTLDFENVYYNVSDLLTKAFDGPRFTHLVVNIGMLNP
ncbi:hypothetical protein Tco_0402780, partial [Tanacetum coccineum]